MPQTDAEVEAAVTAHWSSTAHHGTERGFAGWIEFLRENDYAPRELISALEAAERVRLGTSHP